MSETPELHPQPDPPPASTVAEENKPFPITHHSPAPWRLFPFTYTDLGRCPEVCFEIRDKQNCIVAYVAFDPEFGITPLDLADAALIVAAPRLLRALHDLYFNGFLFLSGNVAFEPNCAAAETIRKLEVATRELFHDLRKAGALR